MPEKIRLINHFSPGDSLVMTAAIECLHEQYPGRYLTGVSTSCDAIFENSPWIAQLAEDDPEVRAIEMHCPLIDFSDRRPVHYLNAYVDYLRKQLGVPLELTTNRPHIYLSELERSWMSQVQEITGTPVKYWVVNAGTKQDYTCKAWGHSNYQHVIDELSGIIQFVQIGEAHHLHKPLRNVIDLIGQTDARQLIRLCWNAEGGLGPVTFIQHIFAAFEKPYVSLLGGREPATWTHYPTQTRLSTIGALPCCQFGGCWRSRVVPLGDGDPKDHHLCEYPVHGEDVIPKCMALIEPAEVVRAILRYYEHGVLDFPERGSSSHAKSRMGVRADEPRTGIESLPVFVRRVIGEAQPLSQNTSEDNLGFGWIYYALIRNLRPELVVAIGSAKGFMPLCAARALQDNGSGKLIFIDPSYSGYEHPGWGGSGLWSDPAEVEERIAGFGLTGWMRHLKMTSEEAFPVVKDVIGGAAVGIVIIDGAHTFEHSLRDFEMYSSLMTEGFAVFHDSTSTWNGCEVWRTMDVLRARGYPLITFDREVGLTVVEVRKPPSVPKTWDYLCAESNRAELLFQYAQGIIRRGDRILEAYCGASPLAPFLKGVEIFGFDADRMMIDELRRRHSQHRWEQIDEVRLPYSNLPEEIDVLMSLGVSRGYVSWDPQKVVESVRYLLGRYFPRACLFECAADYHKGEILDDLRPIAAMASTLMPRRAAGEIVKLGSKTGPR